MFSNYNNTQSLFSAIALDGQSTFNNSLPTDRRDNENFFYSIPPGYRFQLIDEVLIFDNLIDEFSDHIIKDVDFYKYSPQELAGGFTLQASSRPIGIPCYSFPSQSQPSFYLHQQIPSTTTQVAGHQVYSAPDFQEDLRPAMPDRYSYQVEDDILMGIINTMDGSTLQASSARQSVGASCHCFPIQNHVSSSIHQQIPCNGTSQLAMHEVKMMQQFSSSTPQSPPIENSLLDETYAAPDSEEDVFLPMLDAGASYQVEDNCSLDSNEYFDASFLFEDSQEPLEH